MDNDFEIEESYRYTVGQFMNLNNGQAKLVGDLKEIFDSYTMPDCCTELPYNNKHNIRFYPPDKTNNGHEDRSDQDRSEKRKHAISRQKENAYDDSNILSGLRHALSSVVKGSGGTVHAIAKITQILIPQTMTNEVATLFFSTIIQSPKQMNEYLTVLFNFTQPGNLERKIHLEFAKLVMSTFKDPPVLKTSPLESGEDRTRRHRSTTCKLIASLFMFDYDLNNPSHLKPFETFSNFEKLCTRVVGPLVQQASTEKDAIRNLADVWGILLPKYGDQLKVKYLDSIKAIYRDTKFKLSDRITLKDYCD